MSEYKSVRASEPGGDTCCKLEEMLLLGIRRKSSLVQVSEPGGGSDVASLTTSAR